MVGGHMWGCLRLLRPWIYFIFINLDGKYDGAIYSLKKKKMMVAIYSKQLVGLISDFKNQGSNVKLLQTIRR